MKFKPAAYKIDGKRYLFWADSDTEFWVTRDRYRLMEDPIDHLYRWVNEDDYDKDFNKLAIFPNLTIAYEIAEATF